MYQKNILIRLYYDIIQHNSSIQEKNTRIIKVEILKI